MDNQKSDRSKARIFEAIRNAAPTLAMDPQTIKDEALELLRETEFARPKLLSDDATEALIKRIEAGMVIGTSCEKLTTLNNLPNAVKHFMSKHSLPPALKVQNTNKLEKLNWEGITTNVDIENDNSLGLCLAQYGVAETGSFVVHSSPEMPILLNFLPRYLIVVIPQSKILHYMDDYALIANDIANKGETPRNMCVISGVSGTTDIEGVLVQGAHGPEVLHIVIVEDL